MDAHVGTGPCRTHPCPPRGMPLIRERLLGPILAASEPLVLLAAPSGFGKSVLARQIAEAVDAELVVWLDLPDEEVSDRLLFSSLADPCTDSPGQSTSDSWALPLFANIDYESDLPDRLLSVRGKLAVLALDNVSAGPGNASLLGLVDAFVRLAARGSRVVITTRSHPESLGLQVPAMVLTADELRLVHDEAESLLGSLSSGETGPAQAQELLHVSAGHLASFVVLARHAALSHQHSASGKAMPASLQARLREVSAAHLDSQTRRVLFACTLLGAGSESDLAATLGSAANLATLAESLPLVTQVPSKDGGFSFRCHDSVTAAFFSRDWAERGVDGFEDIVREALVRLEDRQQVDRLISVLMEFQEEQLASAFEAHGQRLLDSGRSGLVARALDRLPLGTLVSRPRVLLLDASLRFLQGDGVEAERKASVASELARHSGDRQTEVEALTIVDAVNYWRGDIKSSQAALEAVLKVRSPAAAPATELLVRSRLAVGYGLLGDYRKASEQCLRVTALLASAEPNSHARVRAELRLAAIEGGLRGDMKSALQTMLGVIHRPNLPVAMRFETEQNIAGALAEIGRVGRAEEFLASARRLASEHALSSLEGSLAGTASCLASASGDVPSALVLSTACMQELEAAGDLINANYHRVVHAMLLGACDQADAALSCAEEALEFFAARQIVVFTRETTLTVALLLAAMDDSVSARSQAQGVRDALAGGGYPYHELMADLILAELDRRERRAEDGVARLRTDREYILSENANWTTAMIVRILPGVLGPLAEAVAPDRLPLHMLRMVGDEGLAAALEAAASWMPPDRVAALREHADRVAATPSTTTAVSFAGCRARFFGGLEVRTPEVGIVADSAWKKRKARMLFAMLAARRGQDVPREVIFEYLWPEMDEERARNNYYVVLSAMKRAMTGRAGRGAFPYVNANGAMCSIDTSAVRSDLDDFEESLASAHASDDRGDVDSAVKAYSGLMEVYRGDLLPGDVYDDWFAPLRERYRQEFSDAMLRGSTLLADREDAKGALHMLRRALLFDPWREDLYQASLRLQISSGQRSAAVETYVACRARLADDLGLDPSAETRKLYETILAMEDEAEPV